MKTLIIIAALGMQPFQAECLRRYVADDSPREWVAKINAANCNVCHTGASKKQRNEFGKKLDEHALRRHQLQKDAHLLRTLHAERPSPLDGREVVDPESIQVGVS